MDLVLLHSTGQGALGWRRVVEALERAGHRAHVIDLPSDHDMLSADYAELVRSAFAGLRSPVVVAHSGAGLLLPATASALKASHQVWLAAWVPDPAASLAEEVTAHGDEAFNPEWIGKDPVNDDEVARRFLYHDCDAETLAWALSTRRDFFPRAVYAERIDPDNGIGSTYIVATEDRTIRPDWQRRLARERLGVEPVEIDSGHCPNVSRPEQLADILAGAGGPQPSG